MGLVDIGGCLAANRRAKIARCAVLHGRQTGWPGLRELGTVVMVIKGSRERKGMQVLWAEFGPQSRYAAPQGGRQWVRGDLRRQGDRRGLCAGLSGFEISAALVPIGRG